MKRIILFVFTIILFAACTKDENDIAMSYGQTQCADQWGYGNSDTETTAKLGTFLDSSGILYSSLSFIKVNPGAVCQACNCPSGGVFTIETEELFVAQLVQLGFTKQ